MKFLISELRRKDLECRHFLPLSLLINLIIVLLILSAEMPSVVKAPDHILDNLRPVVHTPVTPRPVPPTEAKKSKKSSDSQASEMPTSDGAKGGLSLDDILDMPGRDWSPLTERMRGGEHAPNLPTAEKLSQKAMTSRAKGGGRVSFGHDAGLGGPGEVDSSDVAGIGAGPGIGDVLRPGSGMGSDGNGGTGTVSGGDGIGRGISDVTVTGSCRDKESIRQLVDRNKIILGEIHRTHSEDGSAIGHVITVVQFTIRVDGTITDCQAETQIKRCPGFDKKIANAVKRWRFEHANCVVNVHWTVEFQ